MYCLVLQATCQAYSQGWSASELFNELEARDFKQSGGLVPVSLPSSVEATPLGQDAGRHPGAFLLGEKRRGCNTQQRNQTILFLRTFFCVTFFLTRKLQVRSIKNVAFA